jgi:autotransporter-associated beta strand protein
VLGGASANNFNVDKSGAFNWTLLSPSTYTGSTVLRGGTLILKDNAALTGGGPLSLNFTTLSMDNRGLAHVPARTGSSPVSLSGGALSYNARLEGESSATIGALTLSSGANSIAFGAQAGNGGSLNLSSPSLTQTGTATLNITNVDGQLGRGLSSASGQSSQFTLTTAPTLINSIVGGWATWNNTEFLTYLATPSTTGALGFGVLTDTAAGFTADAVSARILPGPLPRLTRNSKTKNSSSFSRMTSLSLTMLHWLSFLSDLISRKAMHSSHE